MTTQERMRRAVIINADDLGRSEGINQGIFEAHRSGVVTSATLMVGYASSLSAAIEVAAHPRLGVGLHVTLTGADPTLPPKDIPTLVDAAGRLPRKPDGLGAARFADVLSEARNQLGIFRRLLGREPTHFDSHHHSHREPVVLEALVALARETGIPVRRSSDAIATRLRREGIVSTDVFVETFFGGDATVAGLVSILETAVVGTTEVMCHPGWVDDELRAASTYADDREREISILTSPEIREAVRRGGVELIHFGELAEG